MSAGTLFSSGLIAGGSIAGNSVRRAVWLYLRLCRESRSGIRPVGGLLRANREHGALACMAKSTAAHVAGAGLFVVLAVILSRFAKRKI